MRGREADELAVGPAARGTGPAAALLKAVTADAPEARAWLLTSARVIRLARRPRLPSDARKLRTTVWSGASVTDAVRRDGAGARQAAAPTGSARSASCRDRISEERARATRERTVPTGQSLISAASA